MDVNTAIVLLTINVIVLSVVIALLLISTIVLIVKLNKVAKNIQETTAHVASVTEWFSPVKVFSEAYKVVQSFKKR